MAGVALVTGAGRGIGEAIAARLARDGFLVAVTDVDAAAAGAVAARICGDGGEARGYALDVSDLPGVLRATEAIEAEVGGITALVNNAGWDHLEPFLDNDPALWTRLVSINLMGPIHVSHTVAGRMVAAGRGGTILNIASEAGRVGSTGESVYAACKAGVIGLTKSLAREFARHEITVNAVCPGPTETALLDDVRSGDLGRRIMSAIERTVPLGRFAEPVDIANAVSFFVSPDAAYVTGQVFSVSGGLTMTG